jgi:hypothetical protein
MPLNVIIRKRVSSISLLKHRSNILNSLRQTCFKVALHLSELSNTQDLTKLVEEEDDELCEAIPEEMRQRTQSKVKCYLEILYFALLCYINFRVTLNLSSAFWTMFCCVISNTMTASHSISTWQKSNVNFSISTDHACHPGVLNIIFFSSR